MQITSFLSICGGLLGRRSFSVLAVLAGEARWIIFLLDTTYLAQSPGQKKLKLELESLPRQNYARFLRTQNATKTLPFRNVKTAPKSMSVGNYGNALTCGWFSEAFLAISAQKLATLADLISTFYKVGTVGS